MPVLKLTILMIFLILVKFDKEFAPMNLNQDNIGNDKKMTIYYIVHSTTLDNINKLASGNYDAPLSALGINQAHQWHNLLMTSNIKFGKIFCSPLQRARETAKIIFPDAIITEDPRLKEINYGSFTHSPTSIINKYRSNYLTEPFPQGESYRDVLLRVKDFLLANSQETTLTIISHQAPQYCLEVLSRNCSFQEAFRSDWRHSEDGWQAYWIYHVDLTKN